MTKRLRFGIVGLILSALITAIGVAGMMKFAGVIHEELNAPSQAETTATDSVRRNSLDTGIDRMLFRSAARWIGEWTFVHRAANGAVIWREIAKNALADGGEQVVLEGYFRGGTIAGHYLGLSDASNPCSIAETDSLATAMTGEPVANGYARVNITRDVTGWPTSSLDSGDWRILSKTCTYTSTGTIGPVNCAVLATTTDNSGVHVAFVALSQARTMANGESLDTTISIKLQ